jgi:hypothetical protein
LATFNAMIGWLFDRLLAPLALLSPLAGLAVVSLVTAVAMLLCIRAASNQARLADVKRQIHACIFECRLFQDDLPAVFRALGEMLRRNVVYLGLTLRPLLWAAVPLALLLTQLDLFFGYRAPVREPLLLTARMRDAAALPDGAASASLEAPDGVRVLTPPIWIPVTSELLWKIEPARGCSPRWSIRPKPRSPAVRQSPKSASATRPARSSCWGGRCPGLRRISSSVCYGALR